MKVDDDTFVNLPKLYNLITEDKSLKNLKHLLIGHCFCSAPHVFKVLSYNFFVYCLMIILLRVVAHSRLYQYLFIVGSGSNEVCG